MLEGLSRLIYNGSVKSYHFLIRLASPVNPKAKLWIDGRKNVFEKLRSKLKGNKRELIWFHVASLGEFEQARPVIENLKKKEADLFILLSFFSPSGFEIRKEYPFADYVTYLPIDSKKNAEKFLNISNPSLIVFVKYEFWFHYLNEAKKREIPILLISALFRKDQIFFKSYGRFYKKILNCFSEIMVQDTASYDLLKKNNIKHASISGDTRFDRVTELASNPVLIPKIEEFKGSSKLLIAGSSWRREELIIKNSLNDLPSDWKILIAPHDISTNHIKELAQLFSTDYCLFSEYNFTHHCDKKILILDNIGRLSSAYKHADIAFVGGAFGSGLHNILEPAAYGIPVIFGPKFSRFPEAAEMINAGAGFTVKNESEYVSLIKRFTNSETERKESGKRSAEFVNSRQGASNKVLNIIGRLRQK